MGRFQSGQMGRSVKPLATPSLVRIQLGPPWSHRCIETLSEKIGFSFLCSTISFLGGDRIVLLKIFFKSRCLNNISFAKYHFLDSMSVHSTRFLILPFLFPSSIDDFFDKNDIKGYYYPGIFSLRIYFRYFYVRNVFDLYRSRQSRPAYTLGRNPDSGATKVCPHRSRHGQLCP